MFFLKQNVPWQNIPHRAFKDIAQLCPTQFQGGGNACAQLRKAVIEQWEPYSHADRVCCSHYIPQVVVRQGHLQIQIQLAIKVIESRRRMEMLLRDFKPCLSRNLPQKIRTEYALGLHAKKEPIREK